MNASCCARHCPALAASRNVILPRRLLLTPAGAVPGRLADCQESTGDRWSRENVLLWDLTHGKVKECMFFSGLRSDSLKRENHIHLLKLFTTADSISSTAVYKGDPVQQ
ncbi:hypothetical protein AGIG_G19088 [Arapaima gigas]